MQTVINQLNVAGSGFVDFVLSVLIQSSILIMLLYCGDKLLRNHVRAVVRYCVWLLILVKLILPPSLSSPISLGPLLESCMGSFHLSFQSSSTEVLPLATYSNGLPVTLTWQGMLLLGWSAAVLTFGLLIIQRHLFVRGLVKQAGSADREITDLLGRCRKLMGVTRTVDIRISSVLASPAVYGLFRPVILLPEEICTSFSSDQLRSVLLHELAHIKRGDLWVNMGQTVLQVVYFYNPLLWLANAKIRQLREQAVDETVLVALNEKAQEYPNVLVRVARMSLARPALGLRLIGIVESKGALTMRIRQIINRPLPKTARLSIWGLAAVIVVAVIFLPMAGKETSQPQSNAYAEPFDTLKPDKSDK